jgi:hypothetical protein
MSVRAPEKEKAEEIASTAPVKVFFEPADPVWEPAGTPKNKSRTETAEDGEQSPLTSLKRSVSNLRYGDLYR